MMQHNHESFAALTPAKAKAAALSAFEAATADPAFADWRGLSLILGAALSAKPARRGGDDTPPAWWADYPLPRNYSRGVLLVRFADGQEVRANVHQAGTKPPRVFAACRVAFGFYRARTRREDVPEIAAVENLTTGESYCAETCNRLTVDLRAAPVVAPIPLPTAADIAILEDEIGRRRECLRKFRWFAARELRGESSRMNHRSLLKDIRAECEAWERAIAAGERELARYRREPVAAPERDEADVIEAEDAGEAILADEAAHAVDDAPGVAESDGEPDAPEPSPDEAPYRVRPARYAKGMMAVSCPSRDGFKTRAARLASSLANGRWTGRESAYIMSPRKAERFVKLYAEGWDASFLTGELEPPEVPEPAEAGTPAVVAPNGDSDPFPVVAAVDSPEACLRLQDGLAVHEWTWTRDRRVYLVTREAAEFIAAAPERFAGITLASADGQYPAVVAPEPAAEGAGDAPEAPDHAPIPSVVAPEPSNVVPLRPRFRVSPALLSGASPVVFNRLSA